MILKIGNEISNDGVRYKVTKLLHKDKGAYREEYRAFAYIDENDSEPATVRLIVYKKQLDETFVNVPMIGMAESVLRFKLNGSAFDKYLADFEATANDGTDMTVIITKMNDAKPLRKVIEKKDFSETDAWRVFTDVVIGLKEISHHTNGGCHFGLNPDNIYVYQDAEGHRRGLIRGLNLVCDDFEDNKGLDKSVVLAEFRAPESIVSRFIPRTMQWTLALLLTYMLQRAHPWGLTPDANNYQAYNSTRRYKPQIMYDDGLGDVLRKALTPNPGNRFAEIDDFVGEVMKFSKVEMSGTYECFGKHSAPPAMTDELLESDNDGAIDSGDNPLPTSTSTKDAQVTVEMTVEKGAGFAAVAGMSELKRELRRDFIDVVANRNLADQYCIVPPGMLFYGPPGCGKTYLAEHLAQELGIDYSFVNPADLGSIYIHGSQKMIAELFTKAEMKARKNGKGVLLIFDEMESMVPSRISDNTENQAGEVAEFLTRLNNSSKRGVYVIGLTNCLDKMDKAVLRTGRLDKVVYIDMPDFEARKALFAYELDKRPHADDIDIAHLSQATAGFTSSDITYIVTESARIMFASTLRTSGPAPLLITQSVLEEVIAKTRPSVSAADIRHYEDMRDKYASCEKKRRPTVGFAAGM